MEQRFAASFVHTNDVNVVAAADRVVAANEEPEEEIEDQRQNETQISLGSDFSVDNVTLNQIASARHQNGDDEPPFRFCALDEEKNQAENNGQQDDVT